MHWKTNKLTDLKKDYLTELSNYYDLKEAQALINLLIKYFFGFSRADLAFNADHRLSESEILTLHFAVKELKKYKPVQYITGQTEFLDLHFTVNEQVLIPRPETEEMVLLIINHETKRNLRVLDVGTGSGCIAVSLKNKLNFAEVHANDISNEILEIAEENARLNQSDIKFHKLDILNPDHNPALTNLDIIVSNPPYITENEKADLHENVLKFEPHSALFVPDEDPLLFYKAILKFATRYLRPKGRVYFEINEKMGQKISELLERKNYQEVRLYKDINEKDRFVRATKS